MERKKLLSLIILTFLATMFVCQVTVLSQSISVSDIVTKQSRQKDIGSHPRMPVIQGVSFNWTEFNQTAQPKVWFYINLVVVILVPIIFIIQPIIMKASKKKAATPAEGDEGNSEEGDDDENYKSKVTEQIAPKNSTPLANFIRFAFLTLFIQNITILVLYVAFLVTIPQSITNPDISITILKIYSILFYLDFLAAILAVVGLILIAPTVKRKVQCYIAAGFWIAWIGLGIYPRINSVINIGLFGPTTGLDFVQWAMSFYGRDLFLINMGSIALAIALFNTAFVLFDEGYIKGKGSTNSFGIGNYIVSSGFALVLLVMLTFGETMTGQQLGSLGLLWIVFILGKFLVAPVMGLIAGIVSFKQLNPKKS